MSELSDLPEWVWDLVDVLDRYSDEHPPLYRMNVKAEYERTPCLCDPISKIIPRDVRNTAEVCRIRQLAKAGTDE
jgi:hypothetical protein